MYPYGLNKWQYALLEIIYVQAQKTPEGSISFRWDEMAKFLSDKTKTKLDLGQIHQMTLQLRDRDLITIGGAHFGGAMLVAPMVTLNVKQELDAQITDDGEGDSEEKTKNVQDLLQKTKGALVLCEQGLLKLDEDTELEQETREKLLKIRGPETIVGRKIEKHFKQTWWRELTPNGYAARDVCEKLSERQNLLEELLTSYGSEGIPKEQFIEAGKSYAGIKAVHRIIKTAKKELLIQDNYLDENIFQLLETTNTTVNIKLMGNSKGAFSKYLETFQKERNQNVEYKKNTNCHGRFIIVDRQEIYHLGSSIKDVGNKADMINKVEEDDKIKEIISNFDKWWNEG